jgi:CheY-like chemotaxis protein
MTGNCKQLAGFRYRLPWPLRLAERGNGAHRPAVQAPAAELAHRVLTASGVRAALVCHFFHQAADAALPGTEGPETGYLCRRKAGIRSHPMGALKGRRILVLEEQPSIAMRLVAILREAGCRIAGPAEGVSDALNLIGQETIDAAILDVKIAGNSTLPVARELARQNIPYVFTSGNKSRRLDQRCAPARVITKPYSADHIIEVLLALMRSTRTSRAASHVAQTN